MDNTLDTQNLLAAAADLVSADGRPTHDAKLEQFAGLYLDWILSQMGMSRQTADRREKTSLILHCLLTAGTLGDALKLYGRFARVLWGSQSIVEVRMTPTHAELIFGTVRQAGVTGLMHEMWALARVVSELEWLVQAELKCLSGKVRQPATVDPTIAALFFAKSLFNLLWSDFLNQLTYKQYRAAIHPMPPMTPPMTAPIRP
ncbi:MAG: hypothetical protein EOP84_28455 [Verrucomicrobiaceae bacterium]|nr:MAG: hypothetical protein EOP84_28455 [Verrucomicrobiaceae bacterium]